MSFIFLMNTNHLSHFLYFTLYYLDGINLDFERTMLIKRWHYRSKSEMSVW
jgi:hypothetical protein